MNPSTIRDAVRLRGRLMDQRYQVIIWNENELCILPPVQPKRGKWHRYTLDEARELASHTYDRGMWI
jgi:hypothetical protein